MKAASLITLTLMLAGIFPGVALGVSGIGNGVKSQQSQFETVIPAPFALQPRSSDKAVRALAHSMLGGIRLIPLEYREFAAEFPQLVELSREKTERHFLNLGWELKESSYECVSYLRKTTARGYSVVLTWGEGRGLVLFGPKNPLVESGIEYSLKHLQLYEGACRW